MRKLLSILVVGFFVVGCSSTPSKKVETKTSTTTTEQKSSGTTHVEKTTETAQKSSESVEGEIECTHNKDVRKLAIAKAGGGCEVHYTKLGSTSTVASAASGTSHCETVVTKIKNNLTSAGFTCN